MVVSLDFFLGFGVGMVAGVILAAIIESISRFVDKVNNLEMELFEQKILNNKGKR